MKNIKKCTIMEYGLRLNEIVLPYYLCSCDLNKIYKICEECASTCHKGHELTLQTPDYFKCSCGENCHRINTSVEKYTYKNKCFYHELSQISSLNIYYSDDSEKYTYCIFCYNFCNDYKEILTEKRVKNSEEVPECNCSSKHHKEIKLIFNFTNKIQENKIKFRDFPSIYLFNLIFKCEKSFKNIYSNFIEYFENKILGKNTFEIDKNILNTNYFYSLQNFVILSSKLRKHKYINNTILKFFDSTLLGKLILSKLHKNVTNLIFLSTFLKGYYQITIGKLTNSYVKFNLSEIENMTNFQRLVLISKNNILEINTVIKQLILIMCAMSGNFIEILDVFIYICSIFKRLASLYLLNQYFIINFLQVLDKSFRSFSLIRMLKRSKGDNSKLVEKETILFLKIIKTLLYFSYYYNDVNVMNLISNSNLKCNRENMKILNEKNEIGRLILRISLNILNLTIIEFEEVNKETYSKNKKIIYYGSKILQILGSKNDSYLCSMKRSLKNAYLYMPFLLNTKEFLQFGFIYDQIKFTETKIDEYYNFINSKKELIVYANNSILTFFKLIGRKDKKNESPSSDFSQETNFKKISNKRSIDRSSFKSTQLLINEEKSLSNGNTQELKNLFYNPTYLFSIIKIMEFIEINDQNNDNQNQYVILLFDLIYLFIENNSDNNILIFSDCVFNYLIKVPISFMELLWDLFLFCMNNILKEKNNENLNLKPIIKKISKYFFTMDKLYKYKYKCLNIFLGILELIINANNKIMLDFTCKILIKIYLNNYIFEHIIKYLIALSDDFLHGKQTYFKISDYKDSANMSSDNINNNSILFKLNDIKLIKKYIST